MLRQLAIHNIVLVERLELEFERGLGVLTGETGAGKSILLDALGLALGARADTALVRAGQDAASVTAEIELADDHPALALLTDQGVEAEPGEALIVRRTLKSDGGRVTDGPRRIAWRFGRGAGTASAGRAADRARRGRSRIAGRSARRARPRADRGERGRRPDRPRRRRDGVRSGAAGAGRSAAV